MARKQYALFLCLLMMTVPLTGCFGNSDDDDDKLEPVTPPVLNEWSVHFAGTADDLPTCNDDTNGRLYYVEANNEFQVCKTSGWEVISIQGADGQNGGPGSDGSNGADGAPGADGQDGPAGAQGQDRSLIHI